LSRDWLHNFLPINAADTAQSLVRIAPDNQLYPGIALQALELTGDVTVVMLLYAHSP
jgi:hypothetical protein